jgi:ABC-type multidrug transport system fused ATPase/permease subunit
MTYLTVPIGSAFQAASAIQQGTGALQRINEVLALPREPTEASVASMVATAEPTSATGLAYTGDAGLVLEFRDVWFGYDRQRPVLRGVSLQVPHQGHVALIGLSGAGKSTIFALVERFYDADRGKILFHGKDVQRMDRAACRARIGLVEQHSPVLYGTLRDNVTYSAPDADEDEVQRAVELANLSQLVARLPRGLDTDVGEHGTASRSLAPCSLVPVCCCSTSQLHIWTP